MMTRQQLNEYAALTSLERKTLLRIKQVEMLSLLPEVEDIVREMLCRAIVVDVVQAEMALLAARQMCNDLNVRRAIDVLLQYAAHLQGVATDQLIIGDYA